ncbi:MAG: VCBS repeat-containing protein [Chitinophagaceae bacterium]|nr:VCBS repeat-containing protein [Chitinophagaceae bacterium]
MNKLIPLLLFTSLFIISCKQKHLLFQPVLSHHSGITFNNKIVETDSLNPVDVTNIYNGGGVGIGDFNNDGLQDIYFTGNMVSSKLYLNKGNFKFTDITGAAGAGGEGRWCKGVAVVDINNDGWMDMYVCASMDMDAQKRKNILYINKGLNEDGIPVFKDEAAAYGLDDTTHSTMANFFDYDTDGDLDVYITVNEIPRDVNPSVFKEKITDGSFPSTGRLYRNDMNATLKHPVFTDVSKEAGVTTEGYGHGATVSDINKDGWKDIFVSNDFIANDLLYINNGNGTFTDKAGSYLKHTSANGMGQDIIDINNDGLSDIVELDMSPEDNYRKKMMLPASSYQTFQLNDFFKYQYQYVRNSIQLNEGSRINANDSTGDPVFSDIGYFSGIAETDWSWCPLVADFDNDGWRDIIVTNGFPKDVTDRDFIAYRQEAAPITPQKKTLAQIPEVKLHNYAFRNNGNCNFTDVSTDWGLSIPTFSNGAAYVDLDNDGDLDLVVNNINDEASIYKSTVMDARQKPHHYISLKLAGDSLNVNGIGTWVEVYYKNQHQAYEQTPYRGYLSSIQLNPHFGLGDITTIDSLVVKWTDRSKQVLKNILPDQTITIYKKNATEHYNWLHSAPANNTLFKEVTHSLGVTYQHSQTDYIDFNIQKLLPHKLSEYGPPLAAGDINGDGLDDVIIGGNSSLGIMALLQQPDGGFQQKAIVEADAGNSHIQFQNMGTILLDADSDGDPDLYISRGGYESKSNSIAYQDLFLINDGKGNFIADSLALPQNYSSKSCVRAFDYDRDGDLDLFIAGRVDPWNYPKPVSSFIYRNDSKNGTIKFSDVTAGTAKDLHNIGLVCDALITDLDKDGWPDMVLAGEWMPLTFLKNEKGLFKNITAQTGLSGETGWWNSLVAGDFDNDGDIDFIAGNLGHNSFYKASSTYPAAVYAKDFDNNGSYDAIPAIYLRTSQADTTKRAFPAAGRDDMIKQIIGMRSKFQNYKSYATATIEQLFTPEQLNGVLKLSANNFTSSFCRNNGNGTFTLIPLPFKAQLSALNGMVADDFDGDGNLDLAINTNDYSTDVTIGRYDALNGLLLKGNGDGSFITQSILESGIFIPGNGKALVKLQTKNKRYLLAATQNRGPLKLFELKKENNNIVLQSGDIMADITFKDGKKQRQEFYVGSSFLSQSAKFLSLGANAQSVTITDSRGRTRTLAL